VILLGLNLVSANRIVKYALISFFLILFPLTIDASLVLIFHGTMLPSHKLMIDVIVLASPKRFTLRDLLYEILLKIGESN
jgi:hypothetical protein